MPEEGEAAGDSVRNAQLESYVGEALLWRELKAHPEGLRFARRRSTGRYRHDFYCLDARLAIELEDNVPDEIRDEWLARAGIATMHVPRKQIIEASKAAANQIISRAKALLPQSHPAITPPAVAKPHAGSA